YQCHSAQAEKVKGGLLLDTREGLRKGGERGAVVVPGDPDRSRLVRAIRYGDQELQMPPRKRLSPEQGADPDAWAKRGETDPRTGEDAAQSAGDPGRGKAHWAFRAPKAPPLPKVKQTEWPANPIDTFILAKLEEKGMKPSPPADKRTLLRRATFTLTGLPPTRAEVEAFLVDDSPDLPVTSLCAPRGAQAAWRS